jgi:adenylyltransferase/sulfurtransferase
LDGFGPAAQQALADASVAVVGAGGLGSAVLTYLVAAGVGHVTIIDDDGVEESNLARQVLYGPGDCGERKATAAARALHRLNPGTTIVTQSVRLTSDNARELIAGHSIVADCCDSYTTRYQIEAAARAEALPIVWGTVRGWRGQVAVWGPAQNVSAQNEPALWYSDVFGPEPPADPPGPAVLGPAVGVVGTTMAVEAVKALTGTSTPLQGYLRLYDAMAGTWETVRCAHE